MNNFISLNRFASLVKLDAVKNRWWYLLLFESVVGLVLFLFVLFGALKQSSHNYSLMYGWSFLVAGIFISGFAFVELTKRTDNYHYLLLPTSTHEKFLLKFLLLLVIFPLIMLASLAVAGLIGNFLNDILFNRNYIAFSHLFAKTGTFLKAYLIVFPLFMFGSVYFKELGIVKVILSVAGFLFVLTMFILVVYKLLFWNSVDGFGFLLKKGFVFAYPTVHKALPLLQTVLDTIVFMVKYLSPLFFLIMSFIALKEKEV